MTVSRKLKIALLVCSVGFLGLEAAEQFSPPSSYGLISPAEARIGRPATPVSVAGVARRSVRRCAAGVYYC
ncbi:hypothetical protein [Rhizobium sp. CF142]|uniref:hypothetical protein n=1 Tax=Rhizobium sp. CF142 TaxID=1144314 RepID=UPI00026EED83|nr:hypothetical protein [Rhizobium sp. CF142]EJJ28392.1 hypothetical protein PMI11_03301 [Rhizobium sp. CF142]